MKTKIFILALLSAMCMPYVAVAASDCTEHAGTNVTSGTSATYTYGPVDSYYKYSTRQILYTKTDLALAAGKKGTIKSISFNFSPNKTMTKKTSVKIYMANTNITALSTSSYVPYSSFTEVYSGALNCTQGWNEFTLSTPFAYNGLGSLVVLIDDNSNQYDGDAYTFKYHTASTTTGAQIYKRSDSSNEDPSKTTWSSYTAINYRPNTKFCIEESDMPKHNVNWWVNGTNTKTDEVAEGATITLPANPSAPSSCSSKSFYGWTETASYSSETTAPTIITNPTMGTSDLNYYAVFADAGGATTIFSDALNVSGTSAVSSRTNWSTLSTIYGNNGSVRLGSNSYSGYLITDALSAMSGLATITFKIKQYSSDKATLVLSVINGQAGYVLSKSEFDYGSDWTDCSCTLSGAGTSAQLKFYSYNRIALKDVVISCSSYSNYVTNCTSCTDPDPMTMDGECLTNADYSLTENCFTSDNTSTPVFICTSDNKTSCTINGSTFNASAAGTYTIKATQVADGTYCAVDESVNVVVTEPTYNVVATSNNTDLGTVSIEGMVITASPKSCVGYANPAYTVSPNGKATVEQDGNTFTVTPTANCSIQINFAELTKDTYVDHLQGYDDIVKCGSYTAPSLDDKTVVTTGTDCKELHYHFAGWVTSAISKGSEDVPTGMITAGTAMTASGATYIAVWAKQK